MQIELKLKKAAFVTRVDAIRNHASFRIQALESALVETKMKYKREAERAEMKLSEIESHLLNKQKSDRFIDNSLAEVEKLLAFEDNSKP